MLCNSRRPPPPCRQQPTGKQASDCMKEKEQQPQFPPSLTCVEAEATVHDKLVETAADVFLAVLLHHRHPVAVRSGMSECRVGFSRRSSGHLQALPLPPPTKTDDNKAHNDPFAHTRGSEGLAALVHWVPVTPSCAPSLPTARNRCHRHQRQYQTRVCHSAPTSTPQHQTHDNHVTSIAPKPQKNAAARTGSRPSPDERPSPAPRPQPRRPQPRWPTFVRRKQDHLFPSPPSVPRPPSRARCSRLLREVSVWSALPAAAAVRSRHGARSRFPDGGLFSTGGGEERGGGSFDTC